ncbi:MAG: hypothetical protein K8T91_22390 [Planctomycetes bacterium]|nr:hypothetical protein [Planctomycetota bacterium]
MPLFSGRGPFCTRLVLLGLMLSAVAVHADEPKVAKPPVEMSELEKAFAASLSGADLVGYSMRDDKEQGKVTPDRYTIEEAVKLDANHWRIKAGIPVGQVVLVFPLVLEVQWAGDTPVITLTDFAVGPLGTFTARVVFYRGRYAGTWSHGAKDGGNAVGGQIFGRIVPKGGKDEQKKPEGPAKISE